MLNSELFLNEHLFDDDVERSGTREGFGQGLLKLGQDNPNVVALCADLTESTYTHLFAKEFPDRFFEVGVAEQNMATIASGLSVSGKVPFISSYAVFSPGRSWEQIRTTIAYNQANVKIAGHHAGSITGPDGATHQATEDIAIMRCLPGLDVLVPCDAIQAEKVTIATGEKIGPAYLRFSREKTPVLTTRETPFVLGTMQQFWISDKPQVALFATGHLVYQALLAAKKLDNEGIETLVINVATIKPLDEKMLLDVAKQVGAIVTIEDHQIHGGLGGAIAEVLAAQHPTPIEFVGLHDTFGQSGTMSELLSHFGMDEKGIIESVKKVLTRKK